MKGISPLIATVILTAVTLTIAVFIAPWYSNLAKEQTETATSNANIECAYVTLNDLSPTWTSSSNTLSFQVENTGSATVTVQKIQIIYDSRIQVDANYTAATLTGGSAVSVSVTEASNGSNLEGGINTVRVVTSCPKASFNIEGSSISGAS